MKKILTNRSLLTIAISQAVSGIGGWISMLSIFALIIFNGGGTVEQSSFIYLAGLVPMMLASPLAGWLSDHFNRKWLMIVSEFVSGLAILGIVLSTQIETIYGLLIVQSISSSLLTPAWQSALPTLVKRDELTQANALLQQLTSIIKIAAPFLAGLLLSFLRPQQAMILDVISFALSVLILSTLPAFPTMKGAKDKYKKVQKQSEENVLPGTVFHTLCTSTMLQILFLAAFLLMLIMASFDLLIPIFTRDVLRQNASFFSLIIGCLGLGALGGSTYLMMRKRVHNPWHDLIIGMILLDFIQFALMLAAWFQTPLLAQSIIIIGCLIAGLGVGVVVVQSSTILQMLSPKMISGRLSGIFQSIMGMAQLIAFLVIPHLVPEHISFGPYFGICMLTIVALTIIFILIQYRMHKITLEVEKSLEPNQLVSEPENL